MSATRHCAGGRGVQQVLSTKEASGWICGRNPSTMTSETLGGTDYHCKHLVKAYDEGKRHLRSSSHGEHMKGSADDDAYIITVQYCAIID
uniref:Uncharacterized protein n=1 Tax=Angiostrongylus cantonensis TaxID=6313 RepID=A0A0K0DJH8_ANGCA